MEAPCQCCGAGVGVRGAGSLSGGRCDGARVAAACEGTGWSVAAATGVVARAAASAPGC